jgi:hypothetical protein
MPDVLAWLKVVFEWFKPTWKTLVVLVLLSALALFLPGRWLAAIGVAIWVTEHRVLEWGIFGFCSLMLIVSGIESVGKPGLERYRERKRIKNCLENLGMDELLILQKYVNTGKNSVHYLLWMELCNGWLIVGFYIALRR